MRTVHCFFASIIFSMHATSYVANRILLRLCQSSRGSGYVPVHRSERSFCIAEAKDPEEWNREKRRTEVERSQAGQARAISYGTVPGSTRLESLGQYGQAAICSSKLSKPVQGEGAGLRQNNTHEIFFWDILMLVFRLSIWCTPLDCN